MLLLCTANQCRSPMAEVLLRHHLDRAGVLGSVASAGLYEGGAPATPHGIEVMAARGLDLADHRSRCVDQAMLRSADLVLGMARQHVREATVLAPEVLDRTFTLKELARAATDAGPRPADESLRAWLARIAAGRDRPALLGAGHDDALDVADPIGGSRADYERTAALLDDLLGQIVALSFPSPSRSQAAPA